MYEILRQKNDWLKDLIGCTYNKKTLNQINSFYKERHNTFNRSLGKFALVTTLSNTKKSKEILSLGGSSLLRNIKTGIIEENLILNNFGLLFSNIIGTAGSPLNFNLTDISNTSQVFNLNGAYNSVSIRGFIQMGASSIAPTRADYKITTALGASPENTALVVTSPAYTAANTIVYQADANPTGGSGSVNEIVSQLQIENITPALKIVTLAHDAISPTVTYAAGFLLRGSYTWQI